MPSIYDPLNPDELRREYLFRPCESRQELHDWIVTYLGIDYPDAVVDADSDSSPMDMIYEVYSKARANNDPKFRRVLYYAARAAFKTLAVATLEVLVMLHLDRDVCHMAAIEQQSTKAQTYVKEAFRRPYLRDFVIGDNKRTTVVVRWHNPETGHSLTQDEYAALAEPARKDYHDYRYTLEQYRERARMVTVIVCTMTGTNGQHAPFFVCDEADIIANPAAYEEAKRIPSGRDGKLPITVLISTRKTGIGMVQHEINQAKKTGLHVRHWNLIDVTAPCLPERHRPELPRLPLYYSDDDFEHVDRAGYDALAPNQRERYKEFPEAYAGCKGCAIFTGCKTRLATHQTSTSPLLMPLDEAIGRVTDASTEMVLAQDLCRKPTSIGLIYPRFEVAMHVLSPDQAYEKVFGELHPATTATNRLTRKGFEDAIEEREPGKYAGMDFGDMHLFTYAGGYKDGRRMFFTKFFAGAELDIEQQIEVSQPIRDFSIYPDVAGAGQMRLFSKYHFNLIPWQKTDKKWKTQGVKGSIQGGVAIVKSKLRPVGGGDPDLYLVTDVDGDPMLDLFVQAFREWAWVLDAAGQPTGVPSEKWKDYMDAVRYCIMNVFSLRSNLVSTNRAPAPTRSPLLAPSPLNWASDLIAAKTGKEPFRDPDQDPASARPKMRVEISSGKSYYDDPDGDAQATERKSGKKGRLTWSFE